MMIGSFSISSRLKTISNFGMPATVAARHGAQALTRAKAKSES
jgi:hypothetical protein